MERNDAARALLVSVALLCAATLFMSRAINTGGDALIFYTANACIVSFGAIYLPAFFFLNKHDKTAYGVRRISGRVVPLFVIMGVCVYLVSSSLNTALSFLWARLGIPAASGVVPDFSGLRIPLTIIVMCGIPAYSEELLFHGVLMNAYRPCGKRTAILVSALAFTFMHASLTAVPSLVLASVAVGLISYETRSVYPAMIMHFTNNLLSYVTCGLVSTDNAVVNAASGVADSVAAQGEAAVATLTIALIVSYFVLGTVGFFIARRHMAKLMPAKESDNAVENIEVGSAAARPGVLNPPLIGAALLIILLNLYTLGVGTWM